MKYNQTVTPTLTFTSPAGKQGKVIGIEKDFTIPEKWIGNVCKCWWIVSARVENRIIEIRFDHNDKARQWRNNGETEWKSFKDKIQSRATE